MRTKCRFGEQLLIGILSFFLLSAVFTGCGEDYDDDIYTLTFKADSIANALKQQEQALAELRSTVNNLKNEVANQNKIVSVDPFDRNDPSKGFTIRFSDGTSYPIESGEKGAAGEDGTIWTINDEGYWVLENATDGPLTTKFPAIGAPSPYIANGKWVLHDWSTDSLSFLPDTTSIQATDSLNAYIVDKDSYWTLWTKHEIGSTKLDSLNLPKYTSQNKAYAATIELLGFGYYLTDNETQMEEEPDIVFNFGKISSPLAELWQGQHTLSSGTTNVILSELASKTLVVRVNPDTADITKTKFVLQNNLGNEAPIKLGKPVKMTGLLRSDLNDALYNIPIDIEPQSASNISNWEDQMDAKFTLKAKDTDKFEIVYKWVRFHPFHSSGSISINNIGRNRVTHSGTTYTAEVGINKANRIMIYGAYDYYLKVSDSDKDEFGIVINKANGTFKIGKKSGSNTFTLTVYILGLNGNEYTETIEVTPID